MKVLITFFYLFLLLFSSQAMSQKATDFHADMQARKADLKTYLKTQGPCAIQLDTFLGDTKILTLYNDAKKIEGNYFCKNSIKEMAIYAYTKEYCQNINACADVQSFTELSMAMGTWVYLQNLVSNEYIHQELSKKTEEMEKMQLLMDFAKKKYGEKFSSICPSKFKDSLHDSTCSERINKVFSEEQKNCKPMSPSCYTVERFGIEPFNSYVSKSQLLDENKFSSYFTMRVNAQEKLLSTLDDPKIQNLLSLLAGPQKDEEKIKKFYESIYALETMGTLDPILGYFPIGFMSDKKEELRKRLDGFVQNTLKKKLTLNEINSNFHALRLKLANDLADNHCTLSPSYESLCVDSENIISGKKAPMNIVDARKRLDEELINPGNKLKSVSDLYVSGGNRKFDPTESAQLLLESMRCKSFDFEYSAFSKPKNINKKIIEESTQDFMAPFGTQLFQMTHKMDNKSQILLARQNASENEKAASEYHIKRLLGSSARGGSERKERNVLSVKKSGSVNDENKTTSNDVVAKSDNLKFKNKAENPEQQLLEKKIEKNSEINSPKAFKNDFFKNPANDLNRFGQGVIFEPEKNLKDEKTIKENEEASRKIIESGKMKVISDKISAAQEKIKKELKKPQGFEGDEHKQNQIQSLSSEVEELKKQLDKPEEITKNTTAPPGEEKKSTGELQTERMSSEKEVSGSEKRSPSPNVSAPEVERGKNTTTKDSSLATSPVSNELVPAKSETSSATNPSNYRLVLSFGDGISPEQKEASILSKILENNGVAFEILEDGVPVKIIPILEEGKIVYEDGKPKFRKELIKVKNSPRIPAQTSIKKNESKGGEYQKLKSLTDSVLKSKK